jgi:hypothetical protein
LLFTTGWFAVCFLFEQLILNPEIMEFNSQNRPGGFSFLDSIPEKIWAYCRFCSNGVLPSELKVHESICELKYCSCQYCSQLVIREDFTSHYVKLCPKATFPCPIFERLGFCFTNNCQINYTRFELYGHVSVAVVHKVITGEFQVFSIPQHLQIQNYQSEQLEMDQVHDEAASVASSLTTQTELPVIGTNDAHKNLGCGDGVGGAISTQPNQNSFAHGRSISNHRHVDRASQKIDFANKRRKHDEHSRYIDTYLFFTLSTVLKNSFTKFRFISSSVDNSHANHGSRKFRNGNSTTSRSDTNMTVSRVETEPQDAHEVHNKANVVEGLNPNAVKVRGFFHYFFCLCQSYFSSIN